MNALLQKADIAGLVKVTLFSANDMKKFKKLFNLYLTYHRWTIINGVVLSLSESYDTHPSLAKSLQGSIFFLQK